MQFGLQLNSQHPATENMQDRLQELLEQVRLAQAVGFHSIVAPQHYLPAPFQMLQPLPLLARMAAEAKQMRLIAGIMLLSLQNPVALAEDIGTLDAICHGQFTLGVALGYREPEFQAFGVAKADAVPRLIEVLTVLKRLWTEEKVEHQGRFFTIPGVSLTTRPVQHPHPSIWMGADSDPAVRRAARLADTWYITSASGRTIFCCGFNGLGCPKSRYWKRSLSLVSALFHTCAVSSKQMHMRSSHD